MGKVGFCVGSGLEVLEDRKGGYNCGECVEEVWMGV